METLGKEYRQLLIKEALKWTKEAFTNFLEKDNQPKCSAELMDQISFINGTDE